MALADSCTERGRLQQRKRNGEGKGADLVADMMEVPTVGFRKGGGDEEGSRRSTRSRDSAILGVVVRQRDVVESSRRGMPPSSWVVGRRTAEEKSRGEGDEEAGQTKRNRPDGPRPSNASVERPRKHSPGNGA